MSASEETSSLFPLFILSILAIPLVPHTIFKLCCAITKRTKTIYCQCSLCFRSGKYRKSIFKRISSFSTCSNLTLLVLWGFVVILVYYIKHMNYEVQSFEPFSILGLEPGVSDSEIKKAYRKLSILYHPDKNPEPEANKYFVDFISKAYQALTDPVSRQNYEKYGHPDGRQGFRMGIALPYFLMNSDGPSSGLILLGIVGIGILVPLIIAVVYLSWSSKYTGNYIMYDTLATYFHLVKHSLDPSKVWDLFIKSAEFGEIPVRKGDNESLKKLFVAVRRELNIETKKDQANFWKQHPGLVKMTLLLHTQLTRQSASLSKPLWSDFKRMLDLAPRLLQELVKISLLPRRPIGGGCLMPAIGAIELCQNIIQAVPLSARKVVGENQEGIAPFLQLPHFTATMARKIAPKKVHTFQELRDMSMQERYELLVQTGFSVTQVHDIELVLEMMPSITVEVSLETDGEEGIQEDDFVTMYAWVNLKRGNGLKSALPHAPYFPFYKEENFYLLLAYPARNEVWMSEKVHFMDEAASVRSASRLIADIKETLGATDEEMSEAAKSVAERVRNGSRQVIGKLLAPGEGTYNLTAYCLCDSWIGCDAKTDITVTILKKSQAGTRGLAPGEGPKANAGTEESGNEEEAIDEDYDSEYSDDNEDKGKEQKGEKANDAANGTDSSSSGTLKE